MTMTLLIFHEAWKIIAQRRIQLRVHQPVRLLMLLYMLIMWRTEAKNALILNLCILQGAAIPIPLILVAYARKVSRNQCFDVLN